MSYTFQDAAGVVRYAQAAGSGTSGDPDVPQVGAHSYVETATLTFAASAVAQNVLLTWPTWAKSAIVLISNGTAQSLTVTKYIKYDSAISGSASAFVVLYTEAASVAASGRTGYGANAVGTGGAQYKQIAALGQNWSGATLQITITPAAAATGDAKFTVIWSS